MGHSKLSSPIRGNQGSLETWKPQTYESTQNVINPLSITIAISFSIKLERMLKISYLYINSLFWKSLLNLKTLIWTNVYKINLFIQTFECWRDSNVQKSRTSHPEVFLRKDVPKIYSKFTGEHPCRSMISIKLLCNSIEITLRHGRSPVNILHIFRTPFRENTWRWLLLEKI